MSKPDENAETGALRLATSGPALFSSEPQQWAVARLDDGSEVRMRACGDRVEIRTWDPTESCNPPHLDVDHVGPHVIDVRVQEAVPAVLRGGDVFVVTTARGMTESLDARAINTLVSLGLIEHERDDYVLATHDGRGIGPVHHFYRAARP